MKAIQVPFLLQNYFAKTLVSNPLWETLPQYNIETINWQSFPYKPDVRVAIAYSSDEIYLKFWVKEEGIRGMVTNDNGRVFTDSCVEMFIDPLGDGTYYNFEFNCIGYMLLGVGSSRHNRERAGEIILNKVRRSASLGNNSLERKQGLVEWEIAVIIPFSAFFKHSISTLRGKTVSANFQKCGDEMPEPHYVTWNPIETPKPDYHRPEFFGDLYFE